MLSSIIIWFVGFFLSVFLGINALMASFLLGDEAIHFFARIWGKTLCHLCGVKVEIYGKENIQVKKSQIFISNHQGFFDIFAFYGYLGLPLIWIAKKGLFKIPVIGLGMKKAGHIAIDRTNYKQAVNCLDHAVQSIKRGKSLVIFPEGTRTRDGSLNKFKKGSLYLITHAKVPVVPVTIIGSFEVLKKGNIAIKSGVIKIIIDKPIYTSNLKKGEEKIIFDDIKNVIENNLTKTI